MVDEFKVGIVQELRTEVLQFCRGSKYGGEGGRVQFRVIDHGRGLWSKAAYTFLASQRKGFSKLYSLFVDIS